ncbi:hypothetical protein WJX74_009302 [Apatococcus lobatus]|uniref:LysM domain-containing protein n=1 Tax=Apatococcus lobatus TaxID=904363 RepID=A0AAW1RT11_9CHLO
MINVGQSLKVPSSCATSGASAPAPAPKTGPAVAPFPAAALRAPAPAPSSGCPATPGKYTVKSGDTLSAIAMTYGTTVQCLQSANAISNPNMIAVGQTLSVPAPGASMGPASATAAAPAPSSGCPQTPGTYSIKSGDSLSVIASTCGTSVQCLQTANPSITDPSNIKVGQTLSVPSQCAAAAPSSSSTSRAKPYAQHAPVQTQDCGPLYIGDYTLQPGDTIFIVANKCSVTVECIGHSNPAIPNLDIVLAGQKIKVPSSCSLSAGSSPNTAGSTTSSAAKFPRISNMDTGTIIGIAVGSAVGSILILALAMWIILLHRRHFPHTPSNGMALARPASTSMKPPANDGLGIKRSLRGLLGSKHSRGIRSDPGQSQYAAVARTSLHLDRMFQRAEPSEELAIFLFVQIVTVLATAAFPERAAQQMAHANQELIDTDIKSTGFSCRCQSAA